MSSLQPTLFDGARMLLPDAFELTCQSLNAYGAMYDHWAIAFSGGKDSSATATAVAKAIEMGLVKAPKSLTVLMSDTRMELPPLFTTAMKIMAELRARGVKTQVVMPKMEDRFFVYMLGRGVPPPSNTFRWCTAQLKIEPMIAALKALRDLHGQKFLMLTGVRLGESAVRDARIQLSCGKNLDPEATTAPPIGGTNHAQETHHPPHRPDWRQLARGLVALCRGLRPRLESDG